MLSSMRHNVTYGAVLILIGMAIIGCIDNLIRFVAEEAGLFQFHLLRTLIALPILAVIALVAGGSFSPHRWSAVLARTGFLVTSMMLYFGALPVLPIAQVGAGMFTAPIWVLIFSAVFFGHGIGPRRILAVGVGFAGVLIMLRPDVGGLSPLALMPLAAGAFYGMATLSTREWCAGERTLTLLMAFFVGMGIVGLLGTVAIAIVGPESDGFLARGWSPISGRLMGLVVIQAVFSIIAVGLLTRAYQSAETSLLTVFEYSFLGFATFWGWVLWGEALEPRDFAGLGLITLAGLIVALRRPQAVIA